MAVPAVVLVLVEAIRVDGGCDHDTQACGRRSGWQTQTVSDGPVRMSEMTTGDDLLTSNELEDARDGEPLPFAEGEELSHEHKDAQDGEDAGEDRRGLHCLEVVCRGSQRERHTPSKYFRIVFFPRWKSTHLYRCQTK